MRMLLKIPEALCVDSTCSFGVLASLALKMVTTASVKSIYKSKWLLVEEASFLLIFSCGGIGGTGVSA